MDAEATPFLLFGQHRSGTSFLHNVVKRHPRAFSINEPFSQHVPLFRTTELEEWDASAGDPEVPVAALAPESPLNDYLRELRKWLRAPYPAVRGFKETYLLHKLDWLDHCFGPFRGVLLLRDPRAVVASLVRGGLYDSWWRYEELARLYAERSGGSGLAEAELADPVGAAAFVWGVRTRIALRRAAEKGWLVLRLEELVAEPEAELDRLMRWIGLEVAPQQLELVAESWSAPAAEARSTFSYFRAKSDVLERWRSDLDEDQLARIARAVGDLEEAPVGAE